MSRYSQYGNERGNNDRYDRLTNYSARGQSSYASDVRYDDHYGRDNSSDRTYDNRRGSGGGGGRIGSSYERDNRQQSRGRDDRRVGANSSNFRGGYSQMGSGGLLGASPNEPISGPPGNGMGSTTQQQVLAAIQAQQTQSLLAALQAQQLTSLNPSSLLPTPGAGMMRQNDNRGQARQYANRQRPYQQPKRRNQQQEPGPLMKRKRDDNAGQRTYNRSEAQQKVPWKQFRPQIQKEEASMSKETNQRKAEGEEDDVYEIIDEELQAEAEDIEDVEIAPEMIEKVEELRKRTKVDRNIADQDVDKLAVFHFDGQTYKCELCKIVARRIKSIKQHMMGKKHSLNVIEARQAGNDVDRDISDIVLHPENWLDLNPVAKTILKKQTLGFLEAKKKEEEEYRYKHPENFVTYRIDTRKSAMKYGETVLITSVCEANVAIKGFADEKQMFGCEFIKATIGFNCRLCNMNISNGEHVIEHIKTEEHMSNYQKQLEKHGGYHEKLVQRNKEIVSMLEQHEGQELVMYEAFEEETENQRKIRKRYIKPDDPSFVHIEKDIMDMQSGRDEDLNEEKREGDEDQFENSADQHEGDEESALILDSSENIGEGQQFDEESILEEGEIADEKEEDLLKETENHHHQIEEAQQEEENDAALEGGEMYEPSEPTVEEEVEHIEPMEPEPEVELKPKPAIKQVPAVKLEDLKPGKAVLQKKKTAANSSRPLAAKIPKQKVFVSPNTTKAVKGRGGRAMARSSRGGRAAQRSPKVAKNKAVATGDEESFEVIDEVGAGDEE